MADTTNTQGTARATSAQSAAAQKAPLQSGDLMPGRQGNSQYSTHSSQQPSADRTLDYESKHREENSVISEAGAVMDQAKQTVTDVYHQASRSVNETLGKAKDYSRENPGTATLVVFGIGIGVGILLSSGVLNSGRSSRSQRLVPPVMNALSEIAGELFRR